MTTYHTPVLLNESIEGLNIKPGGIYVDVTFGGGGHSREILNRMGEGKLVSFDQDPDAMENQIDDPRFIFCRGNFRFLKNFLKFNNIAKIDGLLADLGVSSHHFDTVERGFTFQGNSPLDMRMNPSANITASEILNQYTDIQLRSLFREYGEVDNAHKLAYAIVAYRAQTKIQTSEQLIEAIKYCIPRGAENKYLAKVYQALRIEVNRELESLKMMLLHCSEVMDPGGRLVVITYHSLEDRLVKNFIKSGNFEGKIEKDFFGNPIAPFKALNNKVITASEEELVANTRSRSAKLRIGEKQ
ncbi:MAG: 16S rRNA (cytosine(1402)-N(4))-methyltransferase RsmH [Bacteroidota bacterium]|nr:16S rRNA (cytosine(1402)-N(4))-methyltransferase RsmH [Bacteroidota bacterium]